MISRIPSIYDFDAIQKPPTAPGSSAAAAAPAPNADSETGMRLFRQWVEATRFANQRGYFDSNNDDGPEFQAACDRASDIEDEIFALPPSAAGLALKIYLRHLHNHMPLSPAEPWKVGAPTEFIDDSEIAMIADVAAVLPELAPFCAAVLEVTARWLGDA